MKNSNKELQHSEQMDNNVFGQFIKYEVDQKPMKISLIRKKISFGDTNCVSLQNSASWGYIIYQNSTNCIYFIAYKFYLNAVINMLNTYIQLSPTITTEVIHIFENIIIMICSSDLIGVKGLQNTLQELWGKNQHLLSTDALILVLKLLCMQCIHLNSVMSLS